MFEEKTKKETSGIVVWDNKYNTGIELIDSQHKQLIELTNELFLACREKDDVLQAVFKNAMSRMVEYVRFHFDAEIRFLTALKYPDLQNHRKKHDLLVENILEAAIEYNEGRKYVPNNFTRTLRDWILSHIGFYDKAYTLYVREQIRTGKLTEEKFREIELSFK